MKRKMNEKLESGQSLEESDWPSSQEAKNNSNIYLVRPPKGGWPHRTMAITLGCMLTGPLRILHSLQTFLICRSMVITSIPCGGLRNNAGRI
jgi:hypothetical protein